MSDPADNAPDPIDVMIGLRVRVRRKALSMSQTELGNRIGVTFQQVQKYERGVNRIAGSTLVRVAQALETTVSALLGEAETGALDADAWGDLAEPQALELVRAFSEITDPKLRKALLSFVGKIGKGEAEED
ncbi:MAG: helix-turn-helix transcriptional regulator [Caulobacteraceae bacterium]